MEKKKFIIEAWAEVEYLGYRAYEIEAESKKLQQWKQQFTLRKMGNLSQCYQRPSDSRH